MQSLLQLKTAIFLILIRKNGRVVPNYNIPIKIYQSVINNYNKYYLVTRGQQMYDFFLLNR